MELAAALPVSRPAVSQHLAVLKAAGLVADRAAGRRRLYAVDPAGLGALRAYLEQLWGRALADYRRAVEGGPGRTKTNRRGSDDRDDRAGAGRSRGAAGIEEAFRVFTAEIAAWWPVAGHSVEPDRVEAVVLEGRLGGRLYERWHDGGEADWGRVVAWEPPQRLVLSWHPDPDRRAATEVEVRFVALEPGHTRVELEHRGWERLGDLGPQARASYDGGWPGVLDSYARPEPALHHARRCLDLAGAEPGVADFDHAYGAEAMARALACAGDLIQIQAAGWHSRATAAGATIADNEDRKLFTEDLATGPWFGLAVA